MYIPLCFPVQFNHDCIRTDHFGQTLSYFAAVFGKPGLLRVLQECACDTVLGDLHGCTPLLFACARGNVECTLILCAAYAKDELLQENSWGKTALDSAREQMQFECAAIVEVCMRAEYSSSRESTDLD